MKIVHFYVASCALALGCAGQSSYLYTPDNPNAKASGLPAQRIDIPQEAPQGFVEVASYGVTQLKTGTAEVPAVHVRMTVTNDGDDTPWQLDTQQQLLEIPGEGQSRAMYVNGDVQTLPTVRIAKHEKRVLDFYFPLPTSIQSDSKLPRFDLIWQVKTPSRAVASRTMFERIENPEATQIAVVDPAWPYWAGYGPYWWYDPMYPRYVFVHTHPIVVRPGPVVVGQFGGRFRARDHR